MIAPYDLGRLGILAKKADVLSRYVVTVSIAAVSSHRHEFLLPRGWHAAIPSLLPSTVTVMTQGATSSFDG